MRKTLFLAVFITSLFIANSYGQGSFYYNFRNPLHSLAGNNASLLVDAPNGVFYTVGPCWDSVNIVSPGLAYPAYGVRFSKWRISDGQLLAGATSQQGLLDTTTGNTRQYIIIDGTNAGLHRLFNGNFLTVISTVDTGSYHRLGLLCIDSVGNKLWMKEYQKPNCIVPGAGISATLLQRTPFGEWIILSRNTCPNSSWWGQTVLMKLDSNFNLVWEKLYAIPQDYEFSPSALLVEPDGYVVGVSLRYEYQNNFTNPSIDRTQIFRVDTSGVMQWTWTSDINEHEGIADIIRTPDSGFVYCGAGAGRLYQGGMPNAAYDFFAMAKKIDKNRQTVQWQFVDTTSYYVARRILPLANGDFLLSGKGRFDAWGNGYYYDYATLYRINGSGQQHWRRKYMWDSVAVLRDGTFYDMAFCGNGDILMTGMVKDESPNRDTTQNSQQAWILKVDSNGCVGPQDPQCSPQAVEQVALPTEGIQVYPNPTAGVVKVSIGTAAQMRVTDLAGRVVMNTVLQAGGQEVSLSNLPNGLYLYRIQTNAGAVFTGKITKQ